MDSLSSLQNCKRQSLSSLLKKPLSDFPVIQRRRHLEYVQRDRPDFSSYFAAEQQALTRGQGRCPRAACAVPIGCTRSTQITAPKRASGRGQRKRNVGDDAFDLNPRGSATDGARHGRGPPANRRGGRAAADMPSRQHNRVLLRPAILLVTFRAGSFASR